MSAAEPKTGGEERGDREERVHSLRADWARLRDEVSEATGEARAFVGEQVEAHPLAAVGAAAGVGFLLGGGVTRQSLTLLLGVGARMAAGYLGSELSALESEPRD